jgi:TetR/AcrR family transcriptional regulator
MARLKKSEREQVLSKTRRLLLDAAAEEFAREGYEGANINRISQSAGFAKGTIYNYFPSKRALMMALIDQTAETHLNYIQEKVMAVNDPGLRLERFFEAGFDFVPEYLPSARVMVNNIYGPDVEFKEYMYQAYLPMFQLVGQEILAPGIAQGIFRQVDPVSTANLLMTVYLGTGSSVDDQGRQWLQAQQVTDFVLYGLRQIG